MKKRLLSLLLALTMALSLAATGAWAADQDSIRVTVTIANQGAIAVGKNNTLMAQVPVTVTDRNGDGKFTYDEAMVAAHEAYYVEGKDGFELNASSGWVTKLWGETGSSSYYQNNASFSELVNAQPIENGDDLSAFVYSDPKCSDKYGFFDQSTVSVKTGEKLALNLQGTGYDENWSLITAPVNNAELITIDKEGAFHELNVTTDANGNATLSFGQAGTYVVSAYGNDDILVPPVDTTPSKDLTKEATSAIANCVTGYQAADKAATCQFGAEWVMLGRIRALDGAQGWKTKDADIQTYAASVMTAIQNGKLSRETVPTNIARVILTLKALGLDAANFCGQNLPAWLYENQSYKNYASNDLIWSLIALNSGDYPAPKAYQEALIDRLTEYQHEKTGGFFYSSEWAKDNVDMTAMAMIALVPYQESNAKAKKMYDSGWKFIESYRRAQGNYKDPQLESDGCCTNAYVVIAKAAAGQKDYKMDAAVSWMLENYLVKNGFQYNGKLNGLSTYQGMMAMAAYQRAKASKADLFDMSDVSKRVIQVAQPKVSGSRTYNGKKQTVTLPASGFYTVSGTTSATAVGKYTVTVTLNDKTNTTWANGSTDDLTLTWAIVPAANPITVKNVTKSASTKTQTVKLGAKAKESAKLSYKSSSKSVKVDKNGKVTISKNFVGKATITITSKATKNYKATTKKVTVTVNPAGTKLTGVKNYKGKKLKAYWKKNTKVTGYQIQYSTSSKFKSAKTVTVKGYKSTSKTITKLTKNKKYYVRVRTYKTVSKVNYYSGWSNVKSITIKK